jgi:small subunit ribosomal protein S17
MARKKKDDTAETPAESTQTAAEETSVEASPDDQGSGIEASGQEDDAVEATSATADDTPEQPSIVDTVAEAAASALETVAVAVGRGAAGIVNAVTGPADGGAEKKVSKRAEKIGIVASDKMMKTVTVRVDRLVKHPVYRKYVKKRKKFMAHDDLGAKIGDKVKIVETRPLSARKRWRVVEIIQKAEL